MYQMKAAIGFLNLDRLLKQRWWR